MALINSFVLKYDQEPYKLNSLNFFFRFESWLARPKFFEVYNYISRGPSFNICSWNGPTAPRKFETQPPNMHKCNLAHLAQSREPRG